MKIPMGSWPCLSSPSIAFVFFCLSLFPSLGHGSDNRYTLDPVKNFCSRWYSSSVIRDDVIYINGGIEKYNGTDQPKPLISINNWLITIPLQSSWNWKTNITINGEPKSQPNPNTGTLPPNSIRGTMFHGPMNHTQVYIYGGTRFMENTSVPQWESPDSTVYSLWSYAYDSGNYRWAQYDISQPWIPNHGLDAEAVDQGYGFYLNGQIDYGTSSATSHMKNASLFTPLEGMVVINLVDSTSNNISTPGLSGGGPRVGGKMEYINEVGDNGILVAIGGQVVGKGPGEVSDPTEGTVLDLSTVDVFDIRSYLRDPRSNGTWYQQKTTGQTPEPRVDFCLSTVAAADNSSYHIYLYGGYNPTKKDTFFDDVYVLTLPAFQWTQLFANGASPRYGHDCHVAGKRQMLTLGGNALGACDWESKGIAVLDMTTITWGSVFQADMEDFKVPQRLLSVTGGTVNGNGTTTVPQAGWTNPKLADVFKIKRSQKPATTNAPASPTSTPPPKKSTNAGGIAGGVVGGVLGIAAIIGAVFYSRRRRHRRGSTDPAELGSNERALLASELDEEKKHKFELSAVGREVYEMDAPRNPVEAPRDTATYAAELPGTNVVKGGKPGVPIVRTPGDELPEPPVVTPGLRAPSPPEEAHTKDQKK